MNLRHALAVSVIALIFVTTGCKGSRGPAAPALSPEQEAKRQAFLDAAMASIPEAGADKTLSPYFFVLSDDPATDRLPLKSTRADVNIAGVIADVAVTQEYANTGTNTIEAVYIFPMSTRAAVHAMRMTIGSRVIEAEIREKQQARKIYEEARAAGKTASLLEQHRPNVFQMNVANILPGDTIKVELRYTELLVSEDNIYEFAYPAVVGPRYSNVKRTDATPDQAWVENPYLHEGEKPTYAFGVDVNLACGMPIAKIASPSHDVGIEYAGKDKAHIALAASKDGGNRDFVLRYSLAGNAIENGLLLYPGEKENFFLLMMEPPARVEAKTVVPREYIFIVDVSGSMHGFPLDVTKGLMRKLFGQLAAKDRFNVLLFAGDNAVMSEQSVPATKANIEKAVAVLDAQQGGGGTELIPALKRALALPRTAGVSRIIVIATDGYVSVEKDAFELIRNNLGEANLFSFGIGSSVNRHLIEGMARAGMGEPFVVLNQGEAPARAAAFQEYIRSPILTGIAVGFDGFDAYDVVPAHVPDLFARRPLIVFGKYKGEPTGAIAVSGRTPATLFERKIAVDGGLASPKNEALMYLWAREKIMYLSDMNKIAGSDKLVGEITKLGLAYHLMTDYTSFVAVDKEIRADGKVVTVKQPLPLPQGVSDYAVGEAGAPRMMKMVAPLAPPMSAGLAREEASADIEVKAAGRVTLDDVKIIEGDDKALNAASIRVSIDARRIESCYGSVLKRLPQAAGTIRMRLVFDTRGRIAKMTFAADPIGDKGLRSCVAKILNESPFPAPSSASRVVAEIAITFMP